MPQIGIARIEDIEDESPVGTARLSDIEDETPPEVKQAIASVPRPRFKPPVPSWSERLLDTSGTPQAELPSSVKEFSERLNEPNHPVPGAFEGHPENVGAIAGEYLKSGPVKFIKGVGRAARAASSFPAPEPGYESRGITHGAHVPAIPDTSTPEFYKGLTEAVSGGGTTLLPLVPAAAVEAPLATGVDLLAGYGTSKVAGAIAHKAGASPEAEEFWRTAGFWFPATRGLLAKAIGLKSISTEGPGVKGRAVSAFGGKVGAVGGVTPDEFAAGVKVGPFEGGVRIPRNRPAAQAPSQPALEGQVAPPPTDIPQPALPPHPGAPVDNIAEGASNAVAMANEEAQAMRMVSGLPATPPPPPAPPAPVPHPCDTGAAGG